jgi:protein TonB
MLVVSAPAVARAQVEADFVVLRGGLRLAPLSQQDTFPTGLPSADAKGITAPKVAHSEQPDYPRSAFDAGVSGIVELEIAIDAEGRLTHARIKKTPHRDLGVAALDCARRWRFKPATKEGVPIAVVATMNVAFKRER